MIKNWIMRTQPRKMISRQEKKWSRPLEQETGWLVFRIVSFGQHDQSEGECGVRWIWEAGRPQCEEFGFSFKCNGNSWEFYTGRYMILFMFFFFLIYFIFAVLGLCFCARAFSSCGKRGPLFIAVRGPLTIAASFVAKHRLQTRRLSSCGSRA